MEAKKILRIVKDDIADLEEISSDFTQEILPSPDEIELALVKTRTVLTALEWLRKYTALQQINLGKSVSADLPVADTRSADESVGEDVELEEPISSEPFTSAPEKLEFFATQVDLLQEQPIDLAAEVSEKSEAADVKVNEVVTEALTSPSTADLVETVIQEDVPQDEEDSLNENYSDQNVEVPIEETVASFEKTNEIEEIPDLEIPPEMDLEGDEKCAMEGERTLGETINGASKTVNDLLSSGKEETEFQATPIKSLWDGIGINDRFLYIRELFESDSDKFENSINELDQLETIQEAVNYLKMNFVWSKTETSQKFLSLIKRRFTI